MDKFSTNQVLKLFYKFLKENKLFGDLIRISRWDSSIRCLVDSYKEGWSLCPPKDLYRNTILHFILEARDSGVKRDEFVVLAHKHYFLSQEWRFYLLKSDILKEDKTAIASTINALDQNMYLVELKKRKSMIRKLYRYRNKKLYEK